MSQHNRTRRRGQNARPLNPHGPDYEVAPALLLERLPVPDTLREQFPPGTPVSRFRLGECSVIVTYSIDRWQLSIAHPERDPTWNEITQARYRILGEVAWMAMYLPPRSDYTNLHRFCFQLVQCNPLPEHI